MAPDDKPDRERRYAEALKEIVTPKYFLSADACDEEAATYFKDQLSRVRRIARGALEEK